MQRRLDPTRPFRFRFDGDMQIDVMLGDELGLSYALRREFEPDVSAFVRRFVRPGMVVLDLGANVGHMTLLAAKRVLPGGSVHAFEPAPSEYAKLEANLTLNHLSHVVANPVAVFDKPGTMPLQVAGRGLGLYNSLGVPLRTDATVESVAVPVTTLDIYCSRASLQRVDLIKLDVEGAEMGVIRGGTTLLSSASAPVLICEFSDPACAGFGHTTVELRQALEGLGYHLYRYHPEQGLQRERMHQRYDYANLIAAKGEIVLS